MSEDQAGLGQGGAENPHPPQDGPGAQGITGSRAPSSQPSFHANIISHLKTERGTTLETLKQARASSCNDGGIRKFHGKRGLAGYSLWGCKELDMTEQLNTHEMVLVSKMPGERPEDRDWFVWYAGWRSPTCWARCW